MIDPDLVVRCADSAGCSTVYPLIYSVGLLLFLVVGFAYTTVLERRLLGFLQHRIGPNRTGPKGLLQPVADGIKLMFKEDVIPANVYKAVYYLAPVLKIMPVLLVAAVIPMGPAVKLPWFAPSLGDVWYEVPMGLADPSVGILWLLAITSLGTYGMVLAGWASNNKYSMLGGLRASAQMISYELCLGLIMAVPIMLADSMSIGDIINNQQTILEWHVFQNPLAAAILMIALLAEISRSPFDLPEAEQELTQGFTTEYSAMKFAAFMLGEYVGMIVISLIAVALFFGGYHLFPTDNMPIIGFLIYMVKVVFFLSGIIWVRATLPRIRYDRLMAFGWKVLLPAAFLSVAWTAIAVVISDEAQSSVLYAILSLIAFVVMVGVGANFLTQLGRRGQGDDTLDPAITGERSGAGYMALQIVGGVISIPAAIFSFFGGLRSRGESPESPSSPDK